MKLIPFLSVGILVLLSSCGNNAKDYANELCSCAAEAGWDQMVDGSLLSLGMGGSDREMQEEMRACALPVLQEMKEEMDDMSDSERKDFTKDFIKAMIETECVDIAMDEIPWDMVMKQFDNMLEEAGSAGSKGATSLYIFEEACDCMSAGDVESDYCEEIMEQAERAYEELSEDEQDEVLEMMEDCM